jgi:hypothetical protein
LPVFQYRKNAVEVSELAHAIDSESMQQDDGRSFALVVIGDPDSVKGSESLHSAARQYACPSQGRKQTYLP